MLAGALGEQVERLLGLESDVRQDAPDAVHQARVSARRLRSLFAAFRPVLLTERTEPLRDELQWLSLTLGAARDAEVIRARINQLVGELESEMVLGPVKARIGGDLARRHQSAMVAVVEALDSPRYLHLIEDLRSVGTELPWRSGANTLGRRELRRIVEHSARRVGRAAKVLDLADPALSLSRRDAGLHDVRKAAKRARYTAEMAVPVLGKHAERLAVRMESLQELLGDHNDRVAIQVELRRLGVAAHLAGENGFTFGVLCGLERERVSADLATFPRALRRARKASSW